MLAEQARRAIFTFREIEPGSHRLWADHRHARETGTHDNGLARKHPHGCHQPAAWACVQVEKVFEFVRVDFLVPETAHTNGEAVNRRFCDQESSPSQEEERSHEIPILQLNCACESPRLTSESVISRSFSDGKNSVLGRRTSPQSRWTKRSGKAFAHSSIRQVLNRLGADT